MSLGHRLALSVRDYECDLQGVVNNAVYQHYLEHARHELLKANGIDFAALTRAGVDLVVVRAELDYKASLRPGDAFEVHTRLTRVSRVKFAFLQELRRVPDDRLILQAVITGVGVNDRGRPYLPPQLLPLLDELE
ncbi:MAG TPA: acyl-CoA thioesterase, partial [Hyphomicrobiales bacterium]|nr:acyl-CoA thioesterase [Hyphomicrobiales bacterium]